jgi:hypothetical protein
VRSFFDRGCYVRPDENPLVIQDSDPIKNFVLTEARARYEKKLSEHKKNIQLIEDN